MDRVTWGGWIKADVVSVLVNVRHQIRMLSQIMEILRQRANLMAHIDENGNDVCLYPPSSVFGCAAEELLQFAALAVTLRGLFGRVGTPSGSLSAAIASDGRPFVT